MRLSRSLLFVVVLFGAACSASPTPEPLPTSFVVAVPTVPGVGGCRGIGLTGASLAGNPSDPRVTWLNTSGVRREIVWPPGYTARFYRFSSPFEVVDASGRVVYRQGDLIRGGCVAGPDNDPASILLIDPAYP